MLRLFSTVATRKRRIVRREILASYRTAHVRLGGPTLAISFQRILLYPAWSAW
jgi:hypothetical protein